MPGADRLIYLDHPNSWSRAAADMGLNLAKTLARNFVGNKMASDSFIWSVRPRITG